MEFLDKIRTPEKTSSITTRIYNHTAVRAAVNVFLFF